MAKPMFPPNTPDSGAPKTAPVPVLPRSDQDMIFLQNMLLWAQSAQFQNAKLHADHGISDETFYSTDRVLSSVQSQLHGRIRQKNTEATVRMMGLVGKPKGGSSQEMVGDIADFMKGKTVGVPRWGWFTALACVGLFHISK